jgi:HPt (histidine-containing phosphotransfer) domain-containing protein
MNPSSLPSKSFDKNYLLRLLNGNTEMMGVLLNEIYHNLPNCLAEINSSLKTNDATGVVTYASRAKSALLMIREDQLALAFSNIEDSAKKGEMTLAENTFTGVFNNTLSRISSMKEAV